MRRRSASALSTAAVRLVSRRDTSYGDLVRAGTEQPLAIDAWILAAASVIHGATNKSPATPTAAAAMAPGPDVSSKK